MLNKKLKIALLVGGSSPEREVSKESSKSIAEAIKNLGHELVLIDPAYGINQPIEEEKFFAKENYSEVKTENYVLALNSPLLNNVDLVFLGLHGKYGEDGTVQSLLELRGLKYTGSKILSSVMAMDKSMSKIMFQHFDVATPNWFVVNCNEHNYNLIKEKIKKFFGFPCVIKPNDQGSTVGLTICRGESEVEESVKLALNFSNKALVEEYIPGREVTVGIIGQQPLPVLEIVPKHGLYDYECKYTDGMSDYIVPAEIPDKTAQHLQQQALLAFNSVECSNYARVDFRLTNDNKNYCLEVNTLPGMTSHSLIPKMAKAIGVSFDELIDKIINYEINDKG
ncbi:d-alanine--d-alanine ligase [hydrocarbon metagenome]|uniref:D-alanine--d-alanine ligase n=1 Tax=hydrocarbon metagenome TaxID=938273 RepID=A0A0W8FZY3_9ZZZZ